MIKQLILNDTLMIDLAFCVFEHFITNNITPESWIDWFIKQSVSPEVFIPILYNTHCKQFMIIYPFSALQHSDIFIRIEHAELIVTPSSFAMTQIVNGYLYFTCYTDHSYFEEFLDLLAIETMKLFVIFFNSPKIVYDTLNISSPAFLDDQTKEIKKKIKIKK
jgi:hypothetical protein